VSILFVDTSVIIECLPLDKLALRKLIPNGPIRLVLALPVLKELERKKLDLNERVRNVARQEIPKIEAFVSRGAGFQFGHGISLELSPRWPPDDLYDDRLQHGIVDDEIIASALDVARREGVRPSILSADTGMRLRTPGFDLPALEPFLSDFRKSLVEPGKSKEPRRPDLVLRLASDSDVLPRCRMKPRSDVEYGDIFEEAMRGVRAMHVHGASGWQRVSNARATRFAESLREYITAWKEFSKRMSEGALLSLVLENRGTQFATGIDLTVLSDASIELAAKLPGWPRFTPPDEAFAERAAQVAKRIGPGVPTVWAFAGLGDDFDDKLTLRHPITAGIDPDAPQSVMESGVKTCKHGRPTALPRMYAFTEGNQISLKYNIVAAELTSPLQGEMTLRIADDDS
jgi:hypothetical protein